MVINGYYLYVDIHISKFIKQTLKKNNNFKFNL